MTKEELYRSKVVSIDEALSKIKSGDFISCGAYGDEPLELLSNIHKIADRVENVRIWTHLTQRPYEYAFNDAYKGRIDMESLFYGPVGRLKHKERRITYIPTDLHNTGKVFAARHTNVFIAAVTPPDKHGFVRMACSQQCEEEAMEAADLVIFEVNPQLPLINGTNQIPIEKVDYFVEVDYPTPAIDGIPITSVERAIAANVAELIDDGACIQLGIGGMPNAVGEALVDKKDLGIHTEMITSVMGMLMEKGVVTNERKTLHRGKTIGAFAFGSQQLYDYLDGNPMVELMHARYVNDPFVIAQNDNMVSINTALQIDLTGQVCSESIGAKQFSGPGGASDFAYGAYRSKGGKSIIALASTAKKGTVSKIRPILDPGSAVTIRRSIVDYIVTEYGVAHLKFKSIKERVNELINICHPDFRADLRKEAEDLMIW